jgi:DNA invertase Pin-like site-specific DNA recombinase
MKVLYTRISTSINQKVDRQIVDKDQFDYVLIDRCSGSIPLFQRPNGGQIEKLITQGELKELHVHSIDRLGRNTIDVLSTWKDFTEKGIRIICKNPSIQNIDEDGKVDQFSSLLTGILSILSQYERDQIRERIMEGVRIRKEKGLYRGRRINTRDTPTQLLKKPKSKKILDYIDKGYTYDDISKIIPCSRTTIVKVKKTREDLKLVHT